MILDHGEDTIRTARNLISGLVAVLALAGGLTACGDDPSAVARSGPGGSDGTFPVTVTVGNGPVTIAARPERIVSISPTATEMLFAVGAAGQVVAVDDQSTYPTAAPRTTLSGFQPNIEAIAGYRPDLVIASDDINGLVDGLGKLGVAVVLLPAATDLDDVYEQIATVGKVTGRTDAATEVVAGVRGRIDAAIAGLPKRTTPLRYYHELDDTLYTVTSKTFVGAVYQLLGLTNVADAADRDGSGYPQLSAEYLVKADPDMIFLADTKCCGQSARTVGARTGWSGLAAVRKGNVVELDDDVASRWGPRVAELVETVAAAVAEVR